jgi:anti-sigma factor RsiW
VSSGPRPEPGDFEIARDATYYRAPEGLRARISAATRAEARKERRPAMLRAFGFAAAFAAVGVMSWNVALMTAMPSREDTLAREVLSAHIRSLMAPGHLNDVQSTDQHTVKPWFAGKLDFAPPVRDLAADGYPLAGGRLDYIDGRSVAELTYQRRLHTVSVFVWPDAGPDTAPAVRAVNGYSLATWKKGAMRYWAVTDAASPEIEHFAQLMAAG